MITGANSTKSTRMAPVNQRVVSFLWVLFDRAQFLRNEDALRPSHLIVFHWIVAKIDDHGMETDLKPHAKRDQISFRGPS
jgi:hypothetical protein